MFTKEDICLTICKTLYKIFGTNLVANIVVDTSGILKTPIDIELTFDMYQKAAKKTAIYPKEYKILYPALGLSGESGEVAEAVKKALRDENGKFSREKKEALKKELGDILWYVSALSSDLGLKLSDVGQTNINKLESRKNRGVLSGSGDNR